MPLTNFSPGATVTSPWLNGVDKVVNGSGTTQGAALVPYTPAGAGAVATNVGEALNGVPVDVVSAFGADQTGVADSSTAIQNAINSGAKILSLRAGTYTVGTPITLASNQTIQGQGAAVTTIIAKAGINFPYVLYNSGGSGINILDVTVDANQANRSGALTTPALCILLTGVTDCICDRVVVQNSLGTGAASGVGLQIGGASNRVMVQNSKALNCGIAGKPSDGFYCSGSDSLIANCIAYLCTDTAFVLESCSRSGIVGSIADTCNSGGAITNAINTDTYGNYINGLTITNWNAAVTGGIQCGCPLNTSTGVLYDTTISNVVMYANTGGALGNGPAINIRQTGAPMATRMLVSNVNIDGATTQGILATATDLVIVGSTIKNTQSHCIDILGGTSNLVHGNKLVSGGAGSYGVVASNSSSVTVTGNYIPAPPVGIYASNTSTITEQFNTVTGATVSYITKDAGATLIQSTTVTPAWGASIVLDASSGDMFSVNASSNIAATVSAPLNPIQGQRITIQMQNTSGGAIAAALSFNAIFKLAAWTNPANTFNRSITFYFNGTNWYEINRTTVDVPN